MNSKTKIVTSLSAFSVFVAGLFPSNMESLALFMEVAGFVVSYLSGLYLFKRETFIPVPYVMLGAFIGSVSYITISALGGAGHNLYPIEIVLHVLTAAVICSPLAFISSFIFFLASKFKGKKP